MYICVCLFMCVYRCVSFMRVDRCVSFMRVYICVHSCVCIFVCWLFIICCWCCGGFTKRRLLYKSKCVVIALKWIFVKLELGGEDKASVLWELWILWILEGWGRWSKFFGSPISEVVEKCWKVRVEVEGAEISVNMDGGVALKERDFCRRSILWWNLPSHQ